MTTEVRRRLRWLPACLLASAAMAASCSASQSPPRPSLRYGIGEIPPELVGDYQVFATNCSKCHDIERAFAAPVTDNHHWELYVQKMMRTPGSGISRREAPHILRFLFWYTDRKAGRVAAYSAPSSEARPATPAPVEAPVPVEPVKEEKVTEPAAVRNETEGEGAP